MTTGAHDMERAVLIIEGRLNTHEAVCSERYANLDRNVEAVKTRINSFDTTLKAVGGAVIMQLLIVVGYLVTTFVIGGG